MSGQRFSFEAKIDTQLYPAKIGWVKTGIAINEILHGVDDEYGLVRYGYEAGRVLRMTHGMLGGAACAGLD